MCDPMMTVVSTLLLFAHSHATKPFHGLTGTEIFQLEELPYFDFAFLPIDRRIGKASSPFERLFSRLHPDERVSGDEFLRLRKRPVNDGALPSGILDPPPLRAGLKTRIWNDSQSAFLSLSVLSATSHQPYALG